MGRPVEIHHESLLPNVDQVEMERYIWNVNERPKTLPRGSGIKFQWSVAKMSKERQTFCDVSDHVARAQQLNPGISHPLSTFEKFSRTPFGRASIGPNPPTSSTEMAGSSATARLCD